MLDALVPDAPPVRPPVTVGGDQLYVTPDGTMPLVPLVGLTVNPEPLHAGLVIAVIAGVGFIVAVTVKGVPLQVAETGVTV
jgi:hypothetical protein